MARPAADLRPVRRRDLLAGGVALISPQLAGCYEAAFGDDGPGTDWPMRRNDTTNTGTTHGSAPSVDPDVRWRFETDRPVVATPVVVEGTAYVGTVDGRLYALDAESGEVEWDVTLPDGVSTPAVVEGTVYVGTGSARDGRLAALDADSGTVEWDVTLPGDDRPPAPTVASGWAFVESPPFGLVAVDTGTGEGEWRAELPGRFDGSPALDGGTLHLGRSLEPGSGDEPRSTIVALEAATGDRRWSVEKRADVRHSPVVVDGTVFVDRFALDAGTGSEVWEAAVPDGRSAPAVAGRTVFVDGVRGLHALEAGTGEQLWVYPDLETVGAPIVAAGTVYATGTDGQLHAIAADTGEQRWRYHVLDRPDLDPSTDVGSSPAVADGAVYVGVDRSVYAIE